MSRRNLWYNCMFINMRFVVLILPVLVCDGILTVGILRKIKKIVISFCVMMSLVRGTCVVCWSSTGLSSCGWLRKNCALEVF